MGSLCLYGLGGLLLLGLGAAVYLEIILRRCEHRAQEAKNKLAECENKLAGTEIGAYEEGVNDGSAIADDNNGVYHT